MLKRFWDWFYKMWEVPMRIDHLRDLYYTDAQLIEREQELHLSSELWLAAGVEITLTIDAGLSPWASILMDAGDWQKEWNVEVDTDFQSMLREACYELACLPSA